MESMNVEIGLKIQQLRLAHGLSQQGLASRIKKSKSLVSSYEMGKVSLSLAMIKLICEALDEDFKEFISGLELND